MNEPIYLKRVKNLTDCQVSYFVLDQENNILTQGTHACFSGLFNGVPAAAAEVYVHHPTKKMAYDPDIIQRYTKDLWDMGFKFSYLGEWGEQTIFQVKLSDMETKNQFCSTLTLIRNLYEAGPACMPEAYFQLLDTNPTMDKFEALQQAHRKPYTYKQKAPENKYGYKIYFGSGHNVASYNTGKLLTIKTLYKRFKKHGGTPFSTQRSALNACWTTNSSQGDFEEE